MWFISIVPSIKHRVLFNFFCGLRDFSLIKFLNGGMIHACSSNVKSIRSKAFFITPIPFSNLLFVNDRLKLYILHVCYLLCRSSLIIFQCIELFTACLTRKLMDRQNDIHICQRNLLKGKTYKIDRIKVVNPKVLCMFSFHYQFNY